MLNFRFKLLFFIIICVLFDSSIVNAYKSQPLVSWMNKCEYLVIWHDLNWAVYNSSRKTISSPNCNTDIVFWAWWLNVNDWIYDLFFRAEDTTISTSPNKMTSVKMWTYKIDMTPIDCYLNKFTIYWIDNQYYNSWKLYYKWNSWSWKFKLDITCTDPGNNNYISNIKEIKFPTLIWSLPKFNTETSPRSDVAYSEVSYKNTVTFSLTYDWSSNNLTNDSKNILWDITNFAFDYAWNSWELKANNTRLEIFDSTWTHNIINFSNVTSIDLTKDNL